MNGFVKLHRQLIEWEWYGDINVRITFIHLLLVANFKAKQWRGNTIERGQVLTSLDHFADDIGITVSQLRTVIKKLKSTGEITTKTTNKNTIITACNYDTYQDREKPSSKQNDKPLSKPTTNKSHSNDKPIATTEECKELKEEKEREEESKKDTPTQEEILQDQLKKIQAENNRLNLELKNQSEAQKGKEKSSAKKEKAKHEFPSNEPRKSYKANANGFPSIEEFEDMPVHEQQIKKKYELELSKFTYPETWTEYLISQFLEWCAGQDDNLKGKFGSTHVRALIRKINGHLKEYDAKVIGDSIELALVNPKWSTFEPKYIIERKNQKKPDFIKEETNEDGTPSYMLGLKQ